MTSTRREFMKRAGIGLSGAILFPMFGNAEPSASTVPAKTAGTRPNIIWIIAEDIGPDMKCYGNPDASTPQLDKLASQGRLYRNAYSACPVCSPSRSALATGMYQTSIGAHNHRSHRGDGYKLPSEVKLFPDRLREAGYYTAKVTKFPDELKMRTYGKVDWNFNPVSNPFDSEKWVDLKKNQPFYAQFNFHETHRPYSKPKKRPDSSKLTLPPYLPDHQITRDDWALYLNNIETLDRKVGALLALLDKEGLSDNTVVFFFGDNGRDCFRGKYFQYEQGSHVPLIVRCPALLPPGSTSDELVSLIDVTATTLALAGATVPKEMHGQPFMGPDAKKREYLFTAMDRMGDKIDRVRTVRDARYKYIRNFHPDKPYLPPKMTYADQTNPNMNLMRKLAAEGKLNAAQMKFMAATRPSEELYDLQADPFELNNLSGSPEHKQILERLRSVLDKWIVETKDQGATPEDPATLKRILDKIKAKAERGSGD
jgi:N-sulfoglucosamine sulfohydrolase